jgi:hypothetical protein
MKIKTFACLAILFITAINAGAQNKMRTIEELSADTSGWEVIKHAMDIARDKFEILPADPAKAKEALYQTQVTAHSPMGAIIYLTGGILIDDGWVRLLGSGSSKLNRSLPQWNKGKTFTEYGEQPKFLLVADDAIGGFFAINGGALGKDLGQIYYFAPDDLKWEPLHITYTEFVTFCFSLDMKLFYSGLRWKTWKSDMQDFTGNDAFSVYPYLWTKEGKDIEKDSKKKVSIQELYDMETTTLAQMQKQ